MARLSLINRILWRYPVTRKQFVLIVVIAAGSAALMLAYELLAHSTQPVWQLPAGMFAAGIVIGLVVSVRENRAFQRDLNRAIRRIGDDQ